jgi:uncharacterized repeat protein (TIGR01451 family)
MRRSRKPRARRRPWARALALVVPLALVLIATLAPSGQARGTRERSPEEEALVATQSAEKQERRQAEREERAQAKQQQREERAAARKERSESSQGEAKQDGAPHPNPLQREREHAVVTFGCSQVTWEWRGFRDTPSPTNTVKEVVTVDHEYGVGSLFTFTGTAATDTISFPILAPGHYTIDAWGHWKHTQANGLGGGFDVHAPVTCLPDPALSVTKEQKLEGGSGSFTESPLSGVTGQTVDYEILVKNTGNVPLTLGSFTDAHCDAGTISEPASPSLAEGAVATYTCKHVLSAEDATVGTYSNTATVTGTPLAGDGEPVRKTSNTVVANVTEASPSGGNGGNNSGTNPGSGSGNGSATGTGTGSTGVLSSTTSAAPKLGVLAFASATVPGLKGAPSGCARKSFRVSVKSTDVASVTFYLDSHKLKTLTAKNARKGLLSIEIDPTKLSVGVHKLTARITMTHTGSTAAKVGSRSVAVLRCHSAVVEPKFTG